VSSLYYVKDYLFFAAADELGHKKSALFVKHLPHDKDVSTQAVLVSDGFKEIVSISSFDNFIYVAD